MSGVTSWNKDSDMVYNHHQCLRGLMLPLLLDEVAHLIVILTEQLVVFMNLDSRVVDRLGQEWVSFV